jgi:hypothetical protein
MLNPNDRMLIIIGSSSKKLQKVNISEYKKGGALGGINHDMNGLNKKYLNEAHKYPIITSSH